MKTFFQVILSIAFLTSYSYTAFANDESVKDKASNAMESAKDTTTEAYQDTKKAVKKGYRKAADKTCEMVNGKMECVAKKVKHSVQNAADEVKDKANDVKKQ